MIKIGILILFVLYIAICVTMFLIQDSIIFKPEKLTANFNLEHSFYFEEISFNTSDDVKLYGMHVKDTTQQNDQLIFYLHGNKGNLSTQGEAAEFYTNLGYDFFTFDYRGYGKSEGENKNEAQFFSDVIAVYNQLIESTNYKEIVIIGYSLGSCSAAMLAAVKKPVKLILLAPYYSVHRISLHRYKILPKFLLKYPFETYKHLKQVKCPVKIIHGATDDALPVKGAITLSKKMKNTDIICILENQGHTDFEDNPEFKNAIRAFL